MNQNLPTLPKPWNYLLPTLGLTWLFWITAALTSIPEPAPVPTVLHYIGGSMPFVVTLAVLFRREDHQYRRSYWLRLVQLRRIPFSWLLLVLLLTPALALLSAGLASLAGTSGLSFHSTLSGSPAALASFAVFILLFGPLPEEMGWRGYALDWLQKKHSPLASSLILGTIWGIWHVPLFFIEGSYQFGLRGSPEIWYFFLSFIPQTIIMTWIFNNTQRSTLSAVLFHWSVNFTGEILELNQTAGLVNILLWIAASAVVAAVWKARNTGRQRPLPGIS